MAPLLFYTGVLSSRPFNKFVADYGMDMKFGFQGQVNTLERLDMDLNCKMSPVLLLDWGTEFKVFKGKFQ